jgi:hypothetical protein
VYLAASEAAYRLFEAGQRDAAISETVKQNYSETDLRTTFKVAPCPAPPLLLPGCRRGCARGGGALSRAGGAQALFRKEEFRLRASADKPALLVAKQELTEAAMSLAERLKLEVPPPRLCRHGIAASWRVSVN